MCPPGPLSSLILDIQQNPCTSSKYTTLPSSMAKDWRVSLELPSRATVKRPALTLVRRVKSLGPFTENVDIPFILLSPTLDLS